MINEIPVRKEVLPVRIIDLSARKNADLLGEYIGQIAQVGMESLQTRFPGRQTELIEKIYNPNNVDLLEKHMHKIANLGGSGVCLAALDSQEKTSDEQLPKLVGFTLFKSNKPRSIAGKLLGKLQAETVDELEFHVSPQANNKGVGAKLLLSLANEAMNRDLLRKPQVTIYGDSPRVNRFLEHYGCTEIEPLRKVVPYFGEGSAPVISYTLSIPEWKTLLLNVFHYSVQKHTGAGNHYPQKQNANVIDLVRNETGKVHP